MKHKRKLFVITIVGAVCFCWWFTTLFGLVKNGGWYPTDQRRLVPTVDG